MATLSINASASISNSTTGGYVFLLPSPSFAAITLSGTGFKAGLQSVGTSAEDLDYGDVAAANVGWLWIRNVDATNYVDWGLDHSGTIRIVGRLKPGEPWQQLRIAPSAQLMFQANTAACLVEYYLLQT